MKTQDNKVLHLTAIPLRSKAAGELDRQASTKAYRQLSMSVTNGTNGDPEVLEYQPTSLRSALPHYARQAPESLTIPTQRSGFPLPPPLAGSRLLKGGASRSERGGLNLDGYPE